MTYGEFFSSLFDALSLKVSIIRTYTLKLAIGWAGQSIYYLLSTICYLFTIYYHYKKEGQILCGFAMETEDLLENSRKKLESKNCDLICANSLREEGAGFGTDTNRITLLTREKETKLDLMTKEQAAHRILDAIHYELAK